ncbi:hypothetical protein [Nitrospina watsonii]|uniref:hypothetical protein n=1 Tax=Nitrospina watsonii TaxID=1323948 RepID=UPI00248F53A2|nr:hypothetical protein [Nitrospina watsonii]
MIFLLTWFLLLSPSPTAANGDDPHDKEDTVLEAVSDALGVVSLWGLVVLNAFWYYHMGVRRLPRRARNLVPDLFVRKPVQWKVRFRNYHYWGNPVMLGLSYLHGWWAEDSNWVLWAGWGLIGVLCLSGLAMKLQGADQPGAQVTRLLHTQHTLSVVMVLLLWVGHLFAD